MSGIYAPFPKDFLWGVATAAYQIEGAAAEDGRTPSVWDTFCRKPGAIRTRPERERGLRGLRQWWRERGRPALPANADVACDHYHRYKEDVALMKSLGVKGYRFSVSWPRVVPGRGVVNDKGLDFYERLIDELLGAGIEPWMTLFHWDMPQWVEDLHRGWESKECTKDFAEYAGVVTKRLGDRVRGIMTINEFFCFVDKAYTASAEPFAPGKVVSRKVLGQVRHNAIYAHGLAAQAARAHSKAPVGLAENPPWVVPIIETAENVAAARRAFRELAGMFLTPIMEGAYPATYIEDMGADMPAFTDGEMKTISTPLDFVGLNAYFPTYVRADATAKRGWSALPVGDEYPKMHMPWLAIGPAILYWGPRLVHELWKPKAIYITENGCAYPDAPDANGEIRDLGRIMYLQNHLIHLQRAAAEGIPARGYFLWSLMDNFEWAMGYTKRFGICHVDYQTQKRTPKMSAHFYADLIKRNAVGG